MRRLITIILSIAAICSCELRPLYIEGETPVNVLVIMDWTQLGGDPEGASIYFYPEDGNAPRVFKTNSVKKETVKVPSGYYNVMVFNRTVDEFTSMSFRDMDTLGTAKAILEGKNINWIEENDTVGRTVYEPEPIVVGRQEHFYVRTESERTVKVWTESDSSSYTVEIDSVMVRPLRTVYTGEVTIRVNGIQNISSMRAYLKGMAGDEYLASRSAGDYLATHVMESWTRVRETTDYTKGYVNTTFKCFGLPEQYKTSRRPEDTKLVVQFKLVDEETVKQFVFNVGENITQNDNELTVTVAVKEEVTLPDVKPKGGSESGFDVNFKDWDEAIDVPIGI